MDRKRTISLWFINTVVACTLLVWSAVRRGSAWEVLWPKLALGVVAATAATFLTAWLVRRMRGNVQ